MVDPGEADVEELELSAWPGMATAHRRNWLLRMSRGFTSRANSAVALVDGADLDDPSLAEVEQLFARHDLPATVRINYRVAAGLDARLAARGYAIRTPSENRVARLGDATAIASGVAISQTVTADWIHDFAACNGRPDFDAPAMTAILGNIVPPAVFARIGEPGRATAVGMGVIDRGVVICQSIAVRPDRRGSGLGKAMMHSLMAAARARGASWAALSVNDGNAAARQLYASLGFQVIGRYHYRSQQRPGP